MASRQACLHRMGDSRFPGVLSHADYHIDVFWGMNMQSYASAARRIAVWGVTVVAGLIAGGLCGGCVTYRVSDKLRIGGFPIPAYAWEKSSSLGWVDFVSPLTLPIMAIDFLIGFFVLGGIVFWLLNRKGKRDKTKEPESKP
jgi:hypothetical protein